MALLGTNRILRNQTRQLVEGLGRTSREVAQLLEAAGVRGVARSSTRCAIAEYLSIVVRTDAHVQDVKVSRRKVVVITDKGLRRATVQLTPAARMFVDAFDEGAYPALLRPKAPAIGPDRVGTERVGTERVRPERPAPERTGSGGVGTTPV